jgi:beta-galactosidase
MPTFNDSAWRVLNLPHDWSIEGPFGAEYASGNGFAPGGIGSYRKHFRLDPACKGKLVAIEFDGVYDHSQVWINGHYVGGRPYGYSSFELDLTPHLKFGEAENVIAVRVDHSRFSDSRWYTGSGIYRHVRLRFTEKLRIAQWGEFVTTPEIKEDSATIQIETRIENAAGAADFSLQSEIITPDGQPAAQLKSQGHLESGANNPIVQRITIPRPQLWSPDTPRLYALRSTLTSGSKIVDETKTPFGVRFFRFDADKGFFLNGTSMKLKGVCVHHDAGALGAAVPAKVWERRLRTLKEMGVNAIRTSHNPPAPELLDLCDRMGFLVKNEAFDEFTPAKNKWTTGWNNGVPSRFGYAENFAEWSVRDAQDLVRRDRNHPCVILWSIGNEIDYQNDPFSHPVLGREYRPEHPPAENLVKHARPLIEAVKALDKTRPVTMALANVLMSDAVGLGEMLDVVGYNYQEPRYPADHAKFPKRVIYGSENSHAFGTWEVVRTNDYISGQFLWTGIDYIGEARFWPNYANGAGSLDLCGFKKPNAWFRQSLWSETPMVYLCASGGGGGGRGGGRGGGSQESWNWPSNATVTVRCYTTCADVELVLNGKTLGTKRKADAVQGELTWQVPFEPGEIKAIGRRDAQALAEFSIKTAGPASRIELLPDVKQLTADGDDVCHVEFRIVDAQGVRVPGASDEVAFAVEGPAEILGVENGDLNSAPTGDRTKRKANRGRGLAILQSTLNAGAITLKASAQGLDAVTVNLQSR